MRRMQRDLVHALSELGVLLGHEGNGNATVLRRPVHSAVLGPIDAAGGDGDIHTLFVHRVQHNTVQSQATVARHPARPMRMVEQASYERPAFAGITAFEKPCRLYPAVQNIRVFGAAECDLPDVLQGNAGVRRKPNGRLLRIGPTLPEIVAGSQQSTPVVLRRSPNPVPSHAAIVGHRINAMPVKVRTANLPTATPCVGAEDECSLGCSDQQDEVTLSHTSVLHAVQDGSCRRAYVGPGVERNNCSGLNGFQSCLDFARTLIALRGFFGQTALNNCPQARWHGRPKGGWQLAHDRRSNLKASVPLKGKSARSRFVEHNSKRPQVAAIVRYAATKNLRRHVGQGAAHTGSVL